MFLRTSISILLSVGLVFLGLAQLPQRSYISAKDFNLTDAEMQIIPYDIATDSNGFVYIAGPYGVHRFDGNNLVPLHKTKLVYQFFFKDEQERVWVFNTGELRLFMVTRDGLIPYQYNHLLTAYSGYNVQSIFLDKQGVLYLASIGIGYLTISPNGELTRQVTQNSGLHGFVVTTLKNGRLFCYSVGQEEKAEQRIPFKVYYQHRDESIVEVTETDEFSFQHRSSLIQHDADNWTLSTGLNYLIKGRKDSLVLKSRFPFQVIKLFEDSRQHVWAGTFNKGIHRLNHQNLRSEEHLFGNDAAAFLCHDPQGGMWAKSNKKGFVFFPNPSMMRYSLSSDSYVPFKIAALHPDHQRLYCPSSSGITIVEDDTTYVLPRPQPIDIPDKDHRTPRDVPTAFYVDTLNHQFCVASINHLGIWNGQKWQIHLLKHPAIRGHRMVGLFATGRDQLIGVSQYEIIQITAGGISRVIPMPETAKRVTSFAVNSEGRIFLGSHNGIWQMKNDTVSRFLIQAEALQEKKITHLTWLHNRLWVQTHNDGFYIVKNGRAEPLLQADGSTLYLDKCFVSDDGEIWSRLKHPTSALVHLQVLNDSVVLSNYMFDDLACQYPFSSNQLVVNNGKILWGVNGGLFQTSVSKLVKEGAAPRAYIRKVSANYVPLPYQQSHILSFKKNSIALEFDATSFRLKPVEFRCRLAGFDSIWIQPPFQGLQYTNLPAGTYRFQVQGKVAQESWGPMEEMTFQIIPPYWQTWWFRLLMGIATVLIIGAVFLIWYSIQQRRATLVIESLKSEQKALRAQMNPHFVYNALNSAQNFLLLGNTSEYNLFMSRLAQLMRSGLEHSRLAFIPLDHELRFLENYLSVETQRFPSRFTYRFDIEDELKEVSDVISLPPLMIQPLCENAIKHGYDSDPVEIVVSFRLKDEHTLMVLIKDNGVGFAARENKNKDRQPLGLNILENRVELLKKQGFEASYKIGYLDMANRKGTSVSLKIPLK